MRLLPDRNAANVRSQDEGQVSNNQYYGDQLTSNQYDYQYYGDFSARNYKDLSFWFWERILNVHIIETFKNKITMKLI